MSGLQNNQPHKKRTNAERLHQKRVAGDNSLNTGIETNGAKPADGAREERGGRRGSVCIRIRCLH